MDPISAELCKRIVHDREWLSLANNVWAQCRAKPDWALSEVERAKLSLGCLVDKWAASQADQEWMSEILSSLLRAHVDYPAIAEELLNEASLYYPGMLR